MTVIHLDSFRESVSSDTKTALKPKAPGLNFLSKQITEAWQSLNRSQRAVDLQTYCSYQSHCS